MVSSPLGGGGEDGKQKHYFPQQVLLVGDGKWGWGWGSLGRDGMRCYVLVWRSNKLSQNTRISWRTVANGCLHLDKKICGGTKH